MTQPFEDLLEGTPYDYSTFAGGSIKAGRRRTSAFVASRLSPVPLAGCLCSLSHPLGRCVNLAGAVRLTKEDIPNLPSILRSIPQETLCAKQRMLARVYRAFLWQRAQGPAHANAYDLTQILLCRRAKALRFQYRTHGRYPAAYLSRRPLECPDTLEKAGIRFD